MESYEVKTNPGGRTQATLKPPTPPKASDFDLTSVRIEPAENGCVVECSYKMKPDVAQKLKARAGKDHYLDYDVRNPSVKKVFAGAEADAIKTAIHAALNGKKESSGEKSPSKVKVRKV
jgi:hypothetical protein